MSSLKILLLPIWVDARSIAVYYKILQADLGTTYNAHNGCIIEMGRWHIISSSAISKCQVPSKGFLLSDSKKKLNIKYYIRLTKMFNHLRATYLYV